MIQNLHKDTVGNMIITSEVPPVLKRTDLPDSQAHQELRESAEEAAPFIGQLDLAVAAWGIWNLGHLVGTGG